MPVGLEITNSNGVTVIDSNFLNFNVVERGTLSRNTWGACQDRGVYPLVFYKLPRSVNDVQAAPFGIVSTNSANNPRSRFGFKGHDSYPVSTPASMEYAIAATGIPLSPPAGGVGLEVYTEAGQLAFNSLYRQPRLVAVASSQMSVSTWFDIAVPNDGADYWVCVPHGLVCGDYWNDGPTEYFDANSAGMYWLNSSTIRIVCGTASQYMTGGWVSSVNYGFSYSGQVTAFVAKILD